jgi:DNA mismatch repair protein PMS2
MPPSQRRGERLSSFKPLMISRELSKVEDADSGSPKEPSEGDQDAGAEMDVPHRVEDDAGNETAVSLIENFVGRGARERAPTTGKTTGGGKPTNAISKDKQKLVNKLGMIADRLRQVPAVGDEDVDAAITSDSMPDHVPRSIHDFNQRIASQRPPTEHALMEIDKSSTHVDQANDSRAASGVVSNAFNRMRPKRAAAEVATITIGSKTTTAILGSTPSKRRRISATPSDGSDSESSHDVSSTQAFGSSMKIFTAPGVRTPRVSKKRSNALHLAGRPEHDHGSSSPRHPSNETERLGVAAANQLRPAAGAGETSHLAEDQVFSPLESARDEAGSDSEPLDEARKKSREDAKVAKLIRQAEEKMAKPSGDSTKRTQQLLRRRGHKNSTTQLTQIVPCSIDRIVTLLQKLENLVSPENNSRVEPATLADVDSAEERLSLTVCKEDFSRMHIVGQFNLGFILAFRPSRRKANEPAAPASEDELFIIDQHASDEKFNFERLQSSTVVQNQPLVKPYTLDLTAIEEEIIIENNDILLTNGFVVSIDTSGEEPVGQRCKLLSLPMSREVTFDTADLEELIALLADSPALVGTATGDRWNSPAKSTHSSIPRPSKVRRLFAMRACRSSVMIGKSLSKAQMTKLVRHMGEIDKPWNCPHGRPTMRHVLGLGAWEGWREEMGEDDPEAWNQVKVDWKGWTKKMKMQRGERETQNGERDRHGKGSRAAGRYPAVDDETEDDDGTEDEAEDDETDSEAGDGEGNGDGDEEEAGDGDDDLEETSTAEDEGEGAEN